VSHDQYVGRRNRILEEIAGNEAKPFPDTHSFDIVLKNRLYQGQIEVRAVQMRVCQRYLHSNAALSSTDVDERFVVGPREQRCDAFRRPHTQASHGSQEESQLLRIVVKALEQASTSMLDFVLRLTRAQSFSE